MNRILIGCLMMSCLVAAISAQAGGSSSSSSSGGSQGSNASYLARLMAASGGARGRGMMGGNSMFPLLALSGGGSDALLPLMMCQGNMNFMCLLALSQGGVI